MSLHYICDLSLNLDRKQREDVNFFPDAAYPKLSIQEPEDMPTTASGAQILASDYGILNFTYLNYLYDCQFSIVTLSGLHTVTNIEQRIQNNIYKHLKQNN